MAFGSVKIVFVKSVSTLFSFKIMVGEVLSITRFGLVKCSCVNIVDVILSMLYAVILNVILSASTKESSSV